MPTADKSKFVRSLETASDADFVADCYRLILLREADPGGLANFVSLIAGGKDRLSVAAVIASSAEAQALPCYSKRVVGEVLALHAATMAAKAWTPARRRRLVDRMNHYFLVLSRSVAAGGQGTGASDEADDPFSDYFHSVIQNQRS